MAVKIRLRQFGRTNRQSFRLVACDSRVKRDGKYLDNLGWYDPLVAEKNAQLDEVKIQEWLDRGAEMSEEAKKLIARVAPGLIKHWSDKQQTKKLKLATQRREARKTKAVAK